MLRTRNSVRRAPGRVSRRHGRHRLWLAGERVNWESGAPVGAWRDDRPHTHCSAFVASAAKRLGIFVLRPPDHGAVLLANAQIKLAEQRRGDGRRLAISARRHFGANARQSGRSRSGGFSEPGSGQTRAYRDRSPIRRQRGDAARTRAVRRSGGGPQRVLDAAKSAASPITGARGRPTEAALCDFSPTS